MTDRMIPADTGERPRGGATEPYGPVPRSRYARFADDAVPGVGPGVGECRYDGELFLPAEPGSRSDPGRGDETPAL